MNDAEHTVLLYLFDVLQIRPDKVETLIAVVDNRPNASKQYLEILNTIRNSKDVIQTVAEIRRRML